MNLNGPWEFSIDHDAIWMLPENVEWRTTILVPFSPETPASGIGDTGFYRACWYRRNFEKPPIEHNQQAFDFAERLFADGFDMVIFLTGVGTRFLAKLISTRYPDPQFADALRRVTTVARGPKPTAALRELGVTATIIAPEPNTWREVLHATEGRPERTIAIPTIPISAELRKRLLVLGRVAVAQVLADS